MLKRLRIKFIFINMCFVTVLMCATFGFILHFMARNMEIENIQRMQAIAARPMLDPGMGDLPVPPFRPDEEPQEIRLPYFTLFIDEDGTVQTFGSLFDLSDEATLRQILALVSASSEPIGDLDAYNLRFCRVDTPKGQQYIFMDTSSEQAALQSLLRSFLLIGAISFLAFFLVSLFLAQWAVKPVERAWKQQKQFVADASHELKTPLTVIMTNAELLQDPANDAVLQRQFSDNILTMAYQMKGLVEDLLSLARVDNGLSPQDMTQIDFHLLVKDALLLFEPLYFEQGLLLDSQLGASLTLKGSAPHLLQLVNILLDNALKYSSAPGQVSVKLIRQGASCLLSVSNPGPAIPADELTHIFKRFYRLDKARTMRHSYGLGLSIAESIVQEHRGKIWAESSGGQNTFLVQLPLLS